MAGRIDCRLVTTTSAAAEATRTTARSKTTPTAGSKSTTTASASSRSESASTARSESTATAGSASWLAALGLGSLGKESGLREELHGIDEKLGISLERGSIDARIELDSEINFIDGAENLLDFA